MTGANGNNDVTTFRTFFDLPTGDSWPTPTLDFGQQPALHVCTDRQAIFPFRKPCDLDDLVENSLDVEWSGAVAKNAQIVLVSSYPASATDDNLYDSASYIVETSHRSPSTAPHHERELRRVRTGQGTGGNVQ